MKKFLPLVFVQAFLLNFVWEVTQMPLYRSSGMGERADYLAFLGIHWQVSLLDAVTIIVAYLLVGLIMWNVRWGAADHARSNKSAWAIFIAGLLAWQVVVEYLAVYVYHRWAYAPAMPLVFGIGISPLVQMALLPPFAILTSQRFLHWRHSA